MTAEQLAHLAQSLKDNEAFDTALTNARSSALEALATIKRDDEQGFYDAQATVRVVDAIRSDLEQFIRDGKLRSPPGIV